LKINKIKSHITLVALALIYLTPGHLGAVDEITYEFIRVVEIVGDDCPENSNCLLQPYLAVALFSDMEIENRQVGVLLEDYFYCREKTGDVYRAPVGLQTDFLSIPELGQHLIRPKDFMEAAVIHDWLYAVGEPGKQKEADDIFHEILIEQDANLVKRKVMHKAVRWFGKTSFGAREEIPIFNLQTMEIIQPSPLQRPLNPVIAQIDCGDQDEFETVRSSQRSGHRFVVESDDSFQHKGFTKESIDR